MTTPPIQPPVTRFATNFLAIVLLRFKRLVSGLRTTQRAQDDGDDREDLVIGEYPSPHARSLHRPLPPPQLRVEVRTSPTPDLNDVAILQRYALMAQELISSVPSLCCSLGPEDVKLVDEYPVTAGEFADIWEATYGGRKVVLKSYRCYRSFDVTQVVAVRHDRLCRGVAHGSFVEVL